jgi:hypothetical protein
MWAWEIADARQDTDAFRSTAVPDGVMSQFVRRPADGRYR